MAEPGSGLMAQLVPDAPVSDAEVPEEGLAEEEMDVLMADFDNPELPAVERLEALRAALGL